MPLEQTASAIIEFGIKQALNVSVNGWSLVTPLIGQRCVLHIQEPELTLAFNFNEHLVDVSILESLSRENQQDYFDSIPANECYVSVSMFVINELKNTSQLTKLIKEGKLDFYGDLGIVQNVSKLFAELEFDIEETLSNYMGDAQAYTMMAQSQKWRQHIKQQGALFANMLSDAALDEKPIAVRPIMLTYFVDEVRQLKMDTERLEARINKLMAKLHTRQEDSK